MEAFTLEVDGQSRRGPFHRSLTSAALDRKPLSLRNESGADMRVILNVSGILIDVFGCLDRNNILA